MIMTVSFLMPVDRVMPAWRKVIHDVINLKERTMRPCSWFAKTHCRWFYHSVKLGSDVRFSLKADFAPATSFFLPEGDIKTVCVNH
jgi:hypothetical protein